MCAYARVFINVRARDHRKNCTAYPAAVPSIAPTANMVKRLCLPPRKKMGMKVKNKKILQLKLIIILILYKIILKMIYRKKIF